MKLRYVAVDEMEAQESSRYERVLPDFKFLIGVADALEPPSAGEPGATNDLPSKSWTEISVSEQFSK
ncbi:hypothetical protein QF001_001691 [Paraburkholderia youngii]|uniref:hypothetical protein n=1 Tax=Paraburkholderia youngii TaxID=2782701 RepID=UPI003D263F2A